MDERHDDLTARLEDLGSAPVPPPGRAFVAGLEERLRAGAAGRPPMTVPLPSGRRGPGGLLLAAAAAVVVVMLAVLTRAQDDPGTVTLTSAVGAEAVRPDGTVVGAGPGLVLDEGSVVRTGPGGRAEAAGVVIGPDAEAVVDGGRLRPRVPRHGDRAPSPRPGPPSRPAPDGTGPPPVVTTPPVVVSPPPERTTTTTSTSTTTTAPPQQGRLLLSARRSPDGAVGLAWSRYDGPSFARYVVLRAPHPAEPDYPLSSSTVIVTSTEDRDATRAMDSPPAGERPVYRVVAVDADGRELARSAAVEPGDRSTR